MSSSPAFKWFIALLVPLTFAWKLAAGPGDPNEISETITQFLRHHEFDDVRTEEAMAGMWVVRGRRGECRLFVVEGSSRGWTRDVMRSLANASDRLFFLSHGSIYEYDSTWLTITSDIYVRTLRKIGLVRSVPILGVAASPICAAERLPWKEL